MRLWSLHPEYLDRQGLLACWREGLGALKALRSWMQEEKCGYQNHPQLERFKANSDPLGLLYRFMDGIYTEAVFRNYRFERERMLVFSGIAVDELSGDAWERIPVTRGQLEYEASELLLYKLQTRRGGVDESKVQLLRRDIAGGELELNSVFTLIEGGIEAWERIGTDAGD